jgi:hypothetical protein
MRFWLDAEFNEYKGELISMALVDEDGVYWYGVRECLNPKPWVKENVMPVLFEKVQTDLELQNSLREFFEMYDTCHIIVDWPEDISYFCNFIVTGPGERIETPPLSFQIVRNLPNTADTSIIPHNALADATALRKSSLESGEGHPWI